VIPIKKPDWLSPFEFNALIGCSEKYPPFESFVQKLLQMPQVVYNWYKNPKPEELKLPHIEMPGSASPAESPGSRGVLDLEALRILAIKILRPDRFYFALRNMSEKISIIEDCPDSLSLLNTLDETRPLLILKDGRMEGVKKEGYMTVIESYAEVHMFIILLPRSHKYSCFGDFP